MRNRSMRILAGLALVALVAIGTGGPLAGAATFPKMEIKAGHQGEPEMSYTKGWRNLRNWWSAAGER